MNRTYTNNLMSEQHSVLRKLVHLVQPLAAHYHAMSHVNYDDVKPQKCK